MSTVQHEPGNTAPPPYRIAPQLHQILYKRPGRDKLEPTEDVLPEPPYPQRPDAREMTHNEYLKLNGVRMWKTWGAPYFRSRTLKNRKALRPIIPYLFTDWKCNLDCHYCWSYDNRVKGMTEDVAKRSIDWFSRVGPDGWRAFAATEFHSQDRISFTRSFTTALKKTSLFTCRLMDV